MGIPHKHAAIIKAWADGAEIECSIDKGKTWDFVGNPHWHPSKEYRIKPKPPVKKYQWAYKTRTGGVPIVSNFFYKDEEEFLARNFRCPKKKDAFFWIEKIDSTEEEFPAI